MSRRIHRIIALVTATAAVVIGIAAEHTGAQKIDISALWVEPTGLETWDLFYGPGGQEHAPRHMEFQFVEEDTDGTTPKYVVTDADGVRWKMKLGVESRPETAASRLVWAAGYYANDEYFLASAYLKNVPSQLRRGRSQIGPTGDVHYARLMRLDNRKKIGIWKWKESPLLGTREFNGLRTMMAVINSWDMKDANNAIIETKDGRQIYCVSDLGSSFGGITVRSAEGHVGAFRSSPFIESTDEDGVDFAVPGRAHPLEVVAFPLLIKRSGLRWIGKDIPTAHARWIGERLGKLSPTQIRDAFKASGFSPEEIEGFAKVLEGRIAALKAL
jgi:hypothetical protein